MMVKYKVSDLAKDFGLQSKDIVQILADKLNSAKKTGSTLEPKELDIVFDVLTTENSVKSFDEYFATGAKAREEAAKERKAEKDRNYITTLFFGFTSLASLIVALVALFKGVG